MEYKTHETIYDVLNFFLKCVIFIFKAICKTFAILLFILFYAIIIVLICHFYSIILCVDMIDTNTLLSPITL